MKNPINGTVEFIETTFGAIATFSCVVGYNLTGNNGQDTRECLFGGWSGEDPTCESMTNKSFFSEVSLYTILLSTVVDCDQLPPVLNGTINYSGFKFWDTATYSCDVGYDLLLNSQNSSTRICTASGEWSDDPPSCQS